MNPSRNPDPLPLLLGGALGVTLSHSPIESLQLGLWPDGLPLDPDWLGSLRLVLDQLMAGRPFDSDDQSWLALSVVAGYLYRHDPDGLRHIFILDSLIEPASPLHRAASLAVASLVTLACAGAAPDTWLRRVYSFVDGQSDTLDLTLLRIGHVLGWTSVDQAMKHIGRGESPDEIVALALYSALRGPTDMLACVSRLSRIPAAASLAGAVLGAHLGWAGFPSDWRSRCANAATLDELASCITEAQSALGSRFQS